MNAGSIIGGIPLDVLAPLGSTGLLALVVLLILRGWLVPRGLVPAAERDEWKDLALELLGQNRDLMEGARASRDVLRALPTAAPERTESA